MKSQCSRSRAGLSLIELLAVITLVGIMVLILVPVVTQVRENARQATCGSNLRQIGMVTFLYANDNKDRLPEITVGYWPHDIDRSIMDHLTELGGTDMDMFYCPSDVSPGRWARWHNLNDAYMSISYVMLYHGTINVRPQYWNAMIREPEPFEIRGQTYVEPISQRVLALDAVMSVGGLNGNFTRIPTPGVALEWYDQTNHLAGRLPAGGNILYLDGRVEFRPWEEMLRNRQTYGARTMGHPEFYW
jgi:prepilin-type processing-associated H-X9-DG protein